MSLLVIQLPARERLGVRGSEAPGAPRLTSELDYVFSLDGRGVTRSGRCAPALLPRADAAVAVLAHTDVAWHRLDIPRAPAARLRTALLGTLEEQLLDEDEALHFALAPEAQPGQPGWVAVVRKPWLQAWLVQLETAGVGVERVVPASRPLPQAAPTADAAAAVVQGHFTRPGPLLSDAAGDAVLLDGPVVPNVPAVAAAADDQPMLVLSRSDGVLCLPMGALARALLPTPDTPVQWTATPAAAAAAEQWLGAPVALRSDAEALLLAASEPGNLRQFDLARRTRGTRAARDVLRQFLSPAWRPVRLGLVGVLVVNLVGLNAHAFQQRQALAGQRAAMDALLREVHPGVRAVLDAPLQMQRETERLRAAAGRPGEGDLEPLLAAAAAAWPASQGPVGTLRYEPGRLQLAVPDWTEEDIAALRQQLRVRGHEARFADGMVSITAAP